MVCDITAFSGVHLRHLGGPQDVLTLPRGSPTHQVWLVLGSRCRRELSTEGTPGFSAVTQGQATSTLKAASGLMPVNKRETSAGRGTLRRLGLYLCLPSTYHITSTDAFPVTEGMDKGGGV